jgi:TolA-binding protein
MLKKKLSASLFFLIFVLTFTSFGYSGYDEKLASKLFTSGEKYYKEGNYPEAIVKMRFFLLKFPAHDKTPRAIIFLASSYHKIGKTDLALNRYKMILDYYRYAKETPDCIYGMLKIHEERKEYDAVLVACKMLDKQHPDFEHTEECRYKLALIPYWELGKNPSYQQLDKIAKDLLKMMDKYPDHKLYKEAKTAWISCQVKKGDLLFSGGKWSEARKSYQALLEKYPKYEKRDYLCFRIAYTYNIEKDFNKAISGYKQFLKDFPKSKWADDACEKLASIYLGFKNAPEKSIYYLRKIKNHYPKSDQAIRAVWILASMYEERGIFRAAIGCYQWIIRIDSKSTAAYKAEGEIRRIRNKTGK